MFVKAISDQCIDRELMLIEKGDEVYGNVKSYKQDFMNINDAVDLEITETDQNGNILDSEWIYEKIRLKLKPNSIQAVSCGCGSRATRYQGEPLCDDCNYEPYYEDNSLVQTPFNF